MDNELKFAVVGHPNEGKSSVVSTLTEKAIRCTSTPGETQVTTPYWIKVDDYPFVAIMDTPGFQSPKRTNKWVESEARQEEFSEWLKRYRVAYKGQPACEADINVLTAMEGVDALLYIVDASKPISPDDRAELAILRSTRKPRIAVFNCKKDASDYLEQWRDLILQDMNLQYEFNAHKAEFDDRIGLFRKMKETLRGKESVIESVISGLQSARQRRIKESAGIIHDLLLDALTVKEQIAMKSGADCKEIDSRLFLKLQDRIRNLEKEAHQKIRKQYKHSKLTVSDAGLEVVEDDLFSDTSIRALGLSRKQLAMGTAIAGSALGAVYDVALGGSTFGVLALTGGVAGLTAGFASAKRLSQKSLSIKIARVTKRDTQRVMSIGGMPNLPYMLIDRALMCHAVVSRRPHAKPGDAHLEEYAEAEFLTTNWSKDDRAKVTAFCARTIKGRLKDGDAESLTGLLAKKIGGAG